MNLVRLQFPISDFRFYFFNNGFNDDINGNWTTPVISCDNGSPVLPVLLGKRKMGQVPVLSR